MPVPSTLAPEDIRDLRDVRFGLFTAIARPRRLVDALRREGLVPAVIVEVGDHGPATPSARRILETAEVDAWLATPKCAVHLECMRSARLSAPLQVLTCIDPPQVRGLTLRSVL